VVQRRRRELALYRSQIRLDEQGRTATLAWHNRRLFDDLRSQPLYRDGFVYLLDQRYERQRND